MENTRNVRRIAQVATAVAMTGAALAACGSTAKTSATEHYGVQKINGHQELVLPYIGVAPAPIAQMAEQLPSYEHELVNPADWLKTNAFTDGAVFVGPFRGKQAKRILWTKYSFAKEMAYANWIVEHHGSYTTLPTVFDGINTTALKAWGGPFFAPDYQFAQHIAHELVLHHDAYTTATPSTATIVASPVTVMSTFHVSGLSQRGETFAGTCVPGNAEVYINHSVQYGAMPETTFFPGILSGNPPFTAFALSISFSQLHLTSTRGWNDSLTVAPGSGPTCAGLLK